MNTSEGDNGPSRIGQDANVIPAANNAREGVTVRYIHDNDKQWYVLRASYGREDTACETIVADGIYAYIPKQYVEREVRGKRKRFLKNILPNLLFVYATRQDVERYVKRTPQLPFLSFYYNHFRRDETGKNPPLTIPAGEMENFILATHSRNKHVLLVQPSQCHFKSGDIVRVIDGPFTGVTGKVARVAGQQRVVLTLSNIGLISTAYIPSAFIQPIEPA